MNSKLLSLGVLDKEDRPQAHALRDKFGRLSYDSYHKRVIAKNGIPGAKNDRDQDVNIITHHPRAFLIIHVTF